MGRAADVLGISRVAVSQNIKTLGGQLGVILFNTHRTGVSPTDDAKKLYPSIKQALDLIIDSENLLDSRNKDTGSIKIAVNNLLADIQIKEYLKNFCTEYPSVKLEFFTRDGMELLEQNKIDFVVELESVFKDTKYKIIDLFTMNCAFIASKAFLAKHGLTETMTKEELLKLHFIARREGWHFYLDAMNPTQEPFVTLAASNDLTYSMARNGIGVGCLSKETLSKLSDPDVIALNVKDVELPQIKVVCGYKTLSCHARAFINGLIKVLSTPPT